MAASVKLMAACLRIWLANKKNSVSQFVFPSNPGFCVIYTNINTVQHFFFYDSTFPTFFLILSDSELLQIQNRTVMPWAPLLACSQTNNPLIARHQNCCDASPSLPLHLRRVMKFKSLIFQLGKCKCKFLWLEWHCPATVMYTIISRSCTASHRYEASSGEHCGVTSSAATTATPRSFKKKKEEREDAWDLKVNCISPFQKLICSRHYPAFASHWKILPFLSHEKQTFPLSGGNMHTAWQTQAQTSFSSFFFFLLKIL